MLSDNPVILLSIINTKLRDVYSSLDALCEDLDESKEDIITELDKINYYYDVTFNQFKLK